MSIEFKRTRIGLDLTLREAGLLCGPSYKTIRRIEEGINHPRFETQDRLVGGYRNYTLQQSVHFATQAKMNQQVSAWRCFFAN